MISRNTLPSPPHPQQTSESPRRSPVNLGAEYENLDQKAYQILKTMIVERRILPGDKIPQEQLAEEMGISRTPLISALKYLEQEKLVQSIPRRGFFVRLFSQEEMISIFELREVLEGLVARRAAELITDDEIIKLKTFFQDFPNEQGLIDIKAYAREDRRFHTFLVDVGAMEFLRSILESCNITSFSYQLISKEGLIRMPQDTLQEHMGIIEAISQRNGPMAENLMRQHFNRSIQVLKQVLAYEKQPGDKK